MTAANTPHELRPILIAGPTGSGKSRLALELAERLAPATIINVDSMQVYAEIPILSAQPTRAEQARAPHRLYGHIPAWQAYSAGRFVREAAEAVGAARSAGRRAILVGGTGLYFKALIEGLSPVPEVAADIRERWRHRASVEGAEALHAELTRRDPEMAARLRPTDPQRIVRALEVLEASGRSLAHWQRQPGTPVIAEAKAVRLVLRPPRADVGRHCDARLEAMFAAGAVEEVARLRAMQLDPALSAMRALGVRPLLRHLAGEIGLEAALELAKAETRQYVKRQETWLERHMIAWMHMFEQQMESVASKIVTLIDASG